MLPWKTATEEEIVEHCSRSNTNRVVLSELDGGLSVIKIKDAVVKCGMGVNQFESANQQRAHFILHPLMIRAPCVYRFFSRDLSGYLVMEYIPGRPLSTLDAEAHLDQVADLLRSFELVQRDTPGALHEGLAFGQLWLSDAPVAPSSLIDIEEYYNSRQLRNTEHMDLCDYTSVFCHLDIAPRNIIVQDDGTLCLVDFASAGFYPRLFEHTVLRLNRRCQNDWYDKLLSRLDALDQREQRQAELLIMACHLGQRYI